jgi:uncharacterized protein
VRLEAFAAAGRPFVEGYGAGGFRVAGQDFAGSVLILPEGPAPWAVTSAAEISLETLAPVRRHGDIEVLLIGCGRRMALLPPSLRAALRAEGIGMDAMDTGAACRTFNVLLGENRRVAAALIKPE